MYIMRSISRFNFKYLPGDFRMVKTVKVLGASMLCLLFISVGLKAETKTASDAKPLSNNITNQDDLASRPIVQISPNSTSFDPLNTQSPYAIQSQVYLFEGASEIQKTLNTLQNIEFEVIPEASLMYAVNENSRSQVKETETTPVKKSSDQAKQQTKPEPSTVVNAEIDRLKQKNKQLEEKVNALKQNKESTLLFNVSEKLLSEFSEERKKQEQSRISALEAKIQSADTQLKAYQNKVELLSQLPNDADSKIKKQLLNTEKQLQSMQDKINLLNSDFIAKETALRDELKQKEQEYAKLSQSFEQLKNQQSRDNAVANELSTQLTKQIEPYKAEIEKLNQEILVLKKAYNLEKSRSEEAVKELNAYSTNIQTQIANLEKQAQNNVQNQSQMLLQWQQRAQIAELNAQKLQQQLQLTENKTIELETSVSKLTAQINKNNQNYQLQLTDLQQRLLNAKRAEQEANRWARAAGSGNANVASNRIVSLQQQLDEIKALEETHRSLSLQKQQELVNLQSQMQTLQDQFNVQIQSKKQLEEQLLQLQQTKTTESKVQEKNTETAITQTKQETQQTKPQAKLSTDAGMKSL